MKPSKVLNFERVMSSTASEDGENMVLTLLNNSEGVTANIGLPTKELPRAVLAILHAGGQARKNARLTPRRLAIGMSAVRIGSSASGLMHLTFATPEGAEITVALPLQQAARLAQGLAKAVERTAGPPPSSSTH